MDSLHAPWRIQYILAPKPAAPAPGEPGLFARIGQDNDDLTHHVIARSRHGYALLNNYPYNGGHLMVVPYKQVADFDGLTEEELLDLMLLLRRCIAALRQVMKPEGFNVGVNLGKCAGAGIAEHLHLHVVPRWNGDTNFMPVLGQTSVVPQALQELAGQLRAALAVPTA